jgi:hypothetical protein
VLWCRDAEGGAVMKNSRGGAELVLRCSRGEEVQVIVQVQRGRGADRNRKSRQTFRVMQSWGPFVNIKNSTLLFQKFMSSTLIFGTLSY